MGLGQRALVEEGDVRLPPPALLDDTLGVGAEDVAPISGATNAEGLASELGGVES
jgi:hypothetical protein